MKVILIALICLGSLAQAQQDSTTSALQISKEETAAEPHGIIPFIGAGGGYTGYENVQNVEGTPGTLKLLGSWYLASPFVFDLGYGTSYQKFTHDDAVNSSITDGAVEVAARYRTDNRWQMGIVADHMFDQGQNFSASQADAQFVGLQVLKEFNMTPSWLARIGARAQGLTNNTDGLVNMYMIDLQIGWNPSAYKPSTRSVAAQQQPIEDLAAEDVAEEMTPVQPSRPVTISEATPTPILQDVSYATLAGGAKEITFGSSRYALNKADQEHLAKMAKALEANKDLFASVEIHGYADATGTAAANKRLSQRRADSVASVLKRSGLKDVEVVAVGEGAASTLGDKTQGRRAELVFKGVKDEDALRRALTEIE